MPAEHDQLPLTDEGKSVFRRGRSEDDTDERIGKHDAAIMDHTQMAAALKQHIGVMEGDQKKIAQSHYDNHMKHADKHKSILSQLDPTHRYARRTLTPTFHPNTTENARTEYINSAKDSITGSTFLPSIHDHLLDKPAKAQAVEAHKGHLLDLRPEKLKKAIVDIAETLLKMEWLREQIRYKFNV
jgi:cobalamin biosynthesis protein CbiD